MRTISAWAVEREKVVKGSEVLVSIYSGSLEGEYLSVSVGLDPAGAEALAARLLTAAAVARGPVAATPAAGVACSRCGGGSNAGPDCWCPRQEVRP